jgi:thiamine biosynthesis lipoprotein
MITIEKEIKQEIMSTDVYICLSSEDILEQEVKRDIGHIILRLKEFEKRYSRFLPESELSHLNKNEQAKVSDELFEMLSISKNYLKLTKGLFDPAILGYLMKEGYVVGKQQGYIKYPNKRVESAKNIEKKDNLFEQVELDRSSNVVKKPKDLMIDLGGIGKGYIVDKINEEIKNKYWDYCLSVGGDMYLGGRDVKNDYENWAIEIENPFDSSIEMPTLLLSNLAIATSGTYKRKWILDGKKKHHIIDPLTKESSKTDIVSSTVIGPDVTFCDILSKSLIIMGLEKAMDYCENNKTSAIFVGMDKKLTITNGAQKYVWKD